MENKDNLISEFIDNDTVTALQKFLDSAEKFEKPIDKIAIAFGAEKGFSKQSDEALNKILQSFKNNLTLLIQKTWVEKSDVALKDSLLYQLDEFTTDKKTWKENFPSFLEIIDNAVFLMFGKQAKSADFFEYTLRIDPEFGIFWWYIGNLPRTNDWSDEKCKLAIHLGMFFLANY